MIDEIGPSQVVIPDYFRDPQSNSWSSVGLPAHAAGRENRAIFGADEILAGEPQGINSRSGGKCFRMKVTPTHGRVAQLGEHLLCKQGVAGSSPVTSTSSSLRAQRGPFGPAGSLIFGALQTFAGIG